MSYLKEQELDNWVKFIRECERLIRYEVYLKHAIPRTKSNRDREELTKLLHSVRKKRNNLA